MLPRCVAGMIREGLVSLLLLVQLQGTSAKCYVWSKEVTCPPPRPPKPPYPPPPPPPVPGPPPPPSPPTDLYDFGNIGAERTLTMSTMFGNIYEVQDDPGKGYISKPRTLYGFDIWGEARKPQQYPQMFIAFYVLYQRTYNSPYSIMWAKLLRPHSDQYASPGWIRSPLIEGSDGVGLKLDKAGFYTLSTAVSQLYRYDTNIVQAQGCDIEGPIRLVASAWSSRWCKSTVVQPAFQQPSFACRAHLVALAYSL